VSTPGEAQNTYGRWPDDDQHKGRRRRNVQAAAARGLRQGRDQISGLSERAGRDVGLKAAIDAFGRVDVVINNAGIENQVPTLEMPLADWERVIRTNLTGTFLCLREAGKVMAKNGGGVIVNISSVHEFIPWPGFAHYCATKGGMKLLMQTAARELAELKTGIRVLNIAPGAIATPINNFVLDDPEARHTVEAEIPIGRFGQPEDIAAAVAWACSHEADYVTGTTIVVDGGMSTYPRFS